MKAFNQFINLFEEVWIEGIFGLNVSEIIIGLLIFLFFYVLRRLFAKFLINRLSKIVLKSSNQLDDTLVEVIEGPLKFLPVVIGFFIASSYIDFSLEVQKFFDLINRSLITIFIFWLLHQLVIPFSFIIKKLTRVFTRQFKQLINIIGHCKKLRASVKAIFSRLYGG